MALVLLFPLMAGTSFCLRPDSYGARNKELIVLYVLQNATQKSQKVFVHVPSEIAAHEVEEIGIFIG